MKVTEVVEREVEEKVLLSLFEEDLQQNEVERREYEKNKIIKKTLYLLDRGHNVCLVGEGSKREVIQKVSHRVQGVVVVVVEGYD